MKLVSVTVEGYKRFEALTTVDVAPSVVALIGPNEAGKSSLLNAMMLLNDNTEIDADTKSSGSKKDISISARYILDDGDRDALAKVPGGKDIKWYRYNRKLVADQTRSFYEISPKPNRDLSTRHRRATELKNHVIKEKVLSRFHEVNSVQIKSAYENALLALQSENDSLILDQIRSIQTFATSMLSFPNVDQQNNADPTVQSVSIHFVKFLRELASYAETRCPSDEASAILAARRPRFVQFAEEDRNLLTSYHLASEVQNPPTALRNLSRLADLDLNRLLESADSAFAGQRTTMLVNANDRLRERFEKIWTQDNLTVRVDFNQPNLEITVCTSGGSFTRVTDRSDGLRSFVALRAFLSLDQFEVPPILLVDEAETHLHYDAQADLVDMFTKQHLAAKVIYSTHSAGCLPMDLGNGIRVVSPLQRDQRSEVKKSIWGGKFAGFTPLVFAMGATTFAFLPSRSVLITEGESEAMILPTLLRESVGYDALPFQIAPGLANVTVSAASLLKFEGSSVLYLTDGNGGGKDLEKKLIDAKVRQADIFSLDKYFGPDCILEDLINPKIYVEALNSVVSIYSPNKPPIQGSDLKSPKRTDSLKTWCNAHSIDAPDKVAVCQNLLDRKAESQRDGISIQLLDQSKKQQAAKMTRSLISRFPKSPSYGVS